MLISKEENLNVFTAKSPENQTIMQMWIWIRNKENLSGTIELQIDYIGFISHETIQNLLDHLRYLQMALSFLWPMRARKAS